ncbi:hypothetical protein BJ684DRAFT_15316 [Piptocephalis cylindrospora]|uniref:Uncharacterized protein n=1 Tax=Piptocephalis cylindrospora TaxID=1907219 RepID=A0A4P9Y6E7_9FUNG|nr:hypothetical protein BJ684DRAFT_15311 [Piptocephalis cylindrospora]RKP14352.1 hypothetical protein BJ684DRAFT_15316 [Piptocephalis cylindrospora]|eukprot:RKP14347.1 hypothetical protein BJ684DRAFT_15311 [Piptocephalis cylindrospora]
MKVAATALIILSLTLGMVIAIPAVPVHTGSRPTLASPMPHTMAPANSTDSPKVTFITDSINGTDDAASNVANGMKGGVTSDVGDIAAGLNGPGEIVAPRVTKLIDDLIAGIAKFIVNSPFVTNPLAQSVITMLLYSTSNVPIIGPILQRIDILGGFGIPHVPRNLDSNGKPILPQVVRLTHADDVVALLENVLRTLQDIGNGKGSLQFSDIFSIITSTVIVTNEIIRISLNVPEDSIFVRVLQIVNDAVNRIHSLITNNRSARVLLPSEAHRSNFSNAIEKADISVFDNDHIFFSFHLDMSALIYGFRWLAILSSGEGRMAMVHDRCRCIVELQDPI